MHFKDALLLETTPFPFNYDEGLEFLRSLQLKKLHNEDYPDNTPVTVWEEYLDARSCDLAEKNGDAHSYRCSMDDKFYWDKDLLDFCPELSDWCKQLPWVRNNSAFFIVTNSIVHPHRDIDDPRIDQNDLKTWNAHNIHLPYTSIKVFIKTPDFYVGNTIIPATDTPKTYFINDYVRHGSYNINSRPMMVLSFTGYIKNDKRMYNNYVHR